MIPSIELLDLPGGSEGRSARQLADAVAWLPEAQENEWDRFVLWHPAGSIYHTTRWKAMIQKAFSHIRGRILVLRDGGGQIVGGLPIYRVGSWLLGSRLVSIPFATVCDPLLTGFDDWKVVLPELEGEQQRTRSKRLEIRAVAGYDPLPATFSSRSHFRHHTLSLDADFERIRRRFDKSSVRQKADKARRAGITVEEHSDKHGMDICHSLLASTRRRLSLPPMPYRFFESMRAHLCPEFLRIFLAYQNGAPIACHIVLTFKDRWISEYSGNADGALSGTNQLLYLETIRHACEAGAGHFSYGRTSINNTGLLSYKRRWGTVEDKLTDYTLRRPNQNGIPAAEQASPAEDSPIYTLCKQMISKAPLPVCKVIGDFCYRHLG